MCSPESSTKPRDLEPTLARSLDMTAERKLEQLETRVNALESTVRGTAETVQKICKSLALLGELMTANDAPVLEGAPVSASVLSEQDLWKLDVERRLAATQSALQELSAVVYKRRE